MRSEQKRKLAYIWTIIAIIVFLSLYFDAKLIQIVSLMRTEVLTDFFLGITFVSSLLIIFLFLTLLFVKENKRKWIPPLWASLILSVIVSFLLKISIQRERPYQEAIVSAFQSLVSANHNTWNFSFPSFQAMMIFAAVPFLGKEFPKFKYVWLVFACLVAFSRVYLGLHFFSDVIFGGIIGYVIGFFALRWWAEKFRIY